MVAVRELRFALVFDDVEAALRVFRDVFGLEQLADFSDGTGTGVIFRVPAATLEIFDRGYAHGVDRIETGSELDYRVRIAVNVESLPDAGRELAAAGSGPVAAPVLTPWGDRNQRFAVDGMQLTLFQSA